MDSLDSKMDSKKNAEIWECKLCNFKCSKKSNYNKHLHTLKHNRHFLDSKKCQKMPNDKWVCECGKSYVYDTGYYRHKKKCNYQEEIKNKIVNKKETDYKGMLEKVMEENAKLMGHIGELIPKIGNNNTVNNKQKINIDKWITKHPDWMNNPDQQNDYLKLVNTSTDDSLLKEDKIIKKVCNSIYVNDEILS